MSQSITDNRKVAAHNADAGAHVGIGGQTAITGTTASKQALTASDLRKVFTNTGRTTTAELVLPDISDAGKLAAIRAEGGYYDVLVTAAYSIVINRAGAATITYKGTSGTTVTSANVGDYIRVFPTGIDTWLAVPVGAV